MSCNLFEPRGKYLRRETLLLALISFTWRKAKWEAKGRDTFASEWANEEHGIDDPRRAVPSFVIRPWVDDVDDVAFVVSNLASAAQRPSRLRPNYIGKCWLHRKSITIYSDWYVFPQPSAINKTMLLLPPPRPARPQCINCPSLAKCTGMPANVSLFLVREGRSDREENDTNATYLVEYISSTMGSSHPIWAKNIPWSTYWHPIYNQQVGNALPVPIPPLTKWYPVSLTATKR